jgi:hypothetical protein
MKINLSGLTLLQVLFVGLKLTNHIDWSWWWVLSPTILQAGLLVFFLALGFLFGFLKVMSRKES